MSSRFTFTSSRYGKRIVNGSHVMTASETFATLQWQEAELARYRNILTELVHHAEQGDPLLHMAINEARMLLYGES